VATEKDRNKIKLLLAVGWMPQRIANALDISLATLKRYFRAELAARDAMRDRLDARRLEVVAEKALSGNPSAMRIFDDMLAKFERMEHGRRIANGERSGDESPRQAATRAEGKKAARKADAAKLIQSNPDLFGPAGTRH
jgi:DNA invertase Pin-like site-specific DNA recombinase